MPLAAGEFHYAGTGEVYVGPVGTPMPATESVALNAAFIGTGITTEDGVTITPSRSVNEERGWQSPYVLDRRVETVDLVAAFTLKQINKTTWNLNFGGGTWTTTGVAPNLTHTYSPPAPEFIDYRAMVIHLVDGVDITRILLPKGMVTDPGELGARRASASGFSISFGLASTGSGDPWNVVSNRPEYA